MLVLVFFMKKFFRDKLIEIRKIIIELYTFFFARKKMQVINNLVLDMALHARGYNNFQNLRAWP